MSLWKLLRAAYNSSGDSARVRIDKSTSSIQTIEYEHHEIHGGSHFFYVNSTTLGNGAGFVITGTTTNTNAQVHLLFDFDATGETDFFVYENSTVSASGTAVTVYNSDRNSTKTSGAKVYSGSTISSSGTQLEHQLIGVTSNPVQSLGSSGNRSYELILKTGTVYSFSFSSNSADNNISWRASWYEHTPHN